jgi:hypothetical protein
MSRLRLCFFAAAIMCNLSSSAGFGQVVTGTPPFGSFGGGPYDTVNLSNLNVHLSIPIMNKAGAGLPFTYAVTYDNSIWYPVGASGNQVWTPVTGWGWNSISDGSTGYVPESISTVQCNEYYNLTHYSFGPYVDALGTSHPVYVTTTPGQSNCSVAPVAGGSSLASDGSGYTLVVSNYTNVQVMSTGGLTINPYVWQGGTFTVPSGSVGDPNGNTISSSYNSSNTTTTFTDTLSTTALTVYAPAPPRLDNFDLHQP